MATVPWFSGSTTIQKTVITLNGIPPPKLSKLLHRVVSKIHLKDEKPFSPEEEERLKAAFSMTSETLGSVLDTISYILEQAVYYNAKPSALQQQLQDIEINGEQIECFMDTWVTNRSNVNEQVRKRTLVPKQLEEVNWQLRLQAGSADQSKMKIPNGVLELTLSEEEKKEKLLMEFSKKELLGLFGELEGIQRKLDELMT